ncbi:MAG: VPLPA-CTERM sorting domain-containing protein [Deltaproteobacteria bacterium]|nr:VPLPA-CTERM sorting domain-containing protein [Deltaproteobacteria bacterium]
MKRILMVTLVMAALLAAGPVLGYDYSVFGTNITIFDGQKNTSTNSWYNTENEDQEVEPGATTGQLWDMEAFYWDGASKTLTLVGGYDLINGEAGDAYDRDRADIVDPGHVFLDVNGNGWDYAIAWDYSATSLNARLYTVGSASVLLSKDFSASDPWQLLLSGLAGTSLDATYLSGMDDGTGVDKLAGDTVTGTGTHNALSFKLGGITGIDTGFSAHFTMECGNDEINGAVRNTPVPVPAAVWLLGSGLAGLVGIRRRRKI